VLAAELPYQVLERDDLPVRAVDDDEQVVFLERGLYGPVEVLGILDLDPGEVSILVFTEPLAYRERARTVSGEDGAYPDRLRFLQGLSDVRGVREVEDDLFLRRWQGS
jgi:hypothetical protein